MLATKPLFCALLLGIASLNGCANAPHLSATNVQISTDSNNHPVAFQALRSEGQTVKGQIRLTGLQPVHFGHVDYRVVDAHGKVTAQGTVEHSAAIKLRNSHRPSLFSIYLPQPLASGDRVYLTYCSQTHR